MTNKLTRLILLSTSTLAMMSAGIGEAMASSKVILQKKGLMNLISGKEKFQDFSFQEGTLPYRAWTKETNKNLTKLLNENYTYVGRSIIEGEVLHTFTLNLEEEDTPKLTNTFLERYKKKVEAQNKQWEEKAIEEQKEEERIELEKQKPIYIESITSGTEFSVAKSPEALDKILLKNSGLLKNDDQTLYHIEIQGKDAFEHFEKDKKFRDDYVIVETFPEEEIFRVVTGNLNLLPATQKSFFHEATTLSELRRVLHTHKKLSQQMDDVELSITVIGKTLIKDALLERDIFNDNNYHVFDPFEDEESGELVLNVTKKQAQGTLIEHIELIDEDEKLDVSLEEMLQEMDQEKEDKYEEIEKKIEEHRQEDPTINLLFTKFEQEIEKETELELERARELHTNASEEQEEIVEETQNNPIEVANEDELYKNEQFVNLQAHQLRNDCNQIMGLELEEYNPEDYITTDSTTASTIAIHNIEEIQQENQLQTNQLEEQINPNEELVNELIEDPTEIVVTVISQEVVLAPNSDVKSKMDLVLEELLARKKSKETTSDSWSSYSESSYWSENSDNYSTSNEESSFYDSEQLAKDIALASDDAEVSTMTLAQKQELHNSIYSGTNADQEKSIQAAQIAPITSIVQDLIANIATSRLTAIGVGAGDEDEQSVEKGLWARAIGGVSTQKALKDLAGYKGKAFGFSIGADIELNDDLLLGAAITHIKSDFKFNDKKKGDSAQASSSAVSLYGSKSVSEKVFVQGSASIVHSDIKVKSLKKITNDVQKYAQAKFASIGAAVDMSVNYLKRFENGSSLTPMIGIKYAKNSDGGFDETGGGLYNINVASRKSQFITARAGAAFNFASINAGSFKITPGLKAVVSQQLLAKSEKVQTTLNWNGQDYKQEVNLQTHQKTALNLGAGVSVSKKNVDLSANYDFTLKKKFQSHEGSLKVRVNF